jgi:DNA-binding response OmpR family regulator
MDSVDSTRPRILIVDDEADLRTVLRLGLEREGFEVLEAENGQVGLARAQAEHPDLVLLDLMLPLLDGYRVCRALKFDDRHRHLPVFILSARSAETDRSLALQMGADAFVRKPYQIGELIARIRDRLTNGRAAA